MERKRTALSAITVFLTACFLFSCAPSVPQTAIPPKNTEALFEAERNNTAIKAEDIVYPEDDVPTVYITTENGYQVTEKNVYSPCNFKIKLNGVFADFESTYTDENGGGAQLQCRGNTSFTREQVRKTKKFSYKLKLDTKADLFGFGESRHWYLINNFFDVSALRNKLAYDFSGALGLPYTENTWVELYYNGEYRGLYLLTESLRIEEGRIDTVNWEEFAEDVAEAYAENNGLSGSDTDKLALAMNNNLSWISSGKITATLSGGKTTVDLTPYFDPESLDLTSGYLIEYDKRFTGGRTEWMTNSGVPVAMKSPQKLATNRDMLVYVRTLIQDFEDALFSPTFHNSKGRHYSEYLDVASLVDYWLVWTLFNNIELGNLSIYYYIDGGKIHFGPCWDFDITAGNIVAMYDRNVGYDKWTPDQKKAWFKEIVGDPYFSVLCQNRWYELKELTDDLIRSLDIYYNYMAESAERCNDKTGSRKNWHLKNVNYGHSYTFEEDYENVKVWLTNRIKWLDAMFAAPDTKIDNSTNSRNANLVTSVSLNGHTLRRNSFDIYGIQTDYTVSVNAAGELTVKVNTTQSSIKSCELYLNGATKIGDSRISPQNRAEFTFDVSLFDLNEGAVNVLYFPFFKEDGSFHSMTSVLIRASAYDETDSEIKTVKCGSALFTVKSGESFVFPEITETRKGFIPEGWTDGENLYLPGESIIISNSLSLFIRHKRTAIFSAMDMAK